MKSKRSQGEEAFYFFYNVPYISIMRADDQNPKYSFLEAERQREEAECLDLEILRERWLGRNNPGISSNDDFSQRKRCIIPLGHYYGGMYVVCATS